MGWKINSAAIRCRMHLPSVPPMSFCTAGPTGCFFCQAEDGIRDIGVTGVQTCALPIFLGHLRSQLLLHVRANRFARPREMAGDRRFVLAGEPSDFGERQRLDVVAREAQTVAVRERDRKSVV